ncbi:MAG: helix-turn-helix transcriptional regulator, partial [Clostridia bacterium]|nr:helix-turn-helix transcriptional regulator [Clostridia bacterium]
ASSWSAPATPTLFDSNNLISHIKFDDIQEFNRVVYLKGMSHLEQKCIIAEREYSRRLIFSDGVVSGLLSEILFECARLVKSPEIESNDKVEQVLDYIHANFDKPITNKDISNAFSFHPNYINELVRKNTGVSLHKYLLQVRIARAIDLIEKSDNSISEIAETCGFQNLYYFSRYFKKAIGMSPTDFRKK